MANIGKAERLIQAAGCGPFQILFTLMVYCLVKVPSTFTMMFMTFGIYSPGWRCLDNVTVSSNLQSGGLHLEPIVSAGNETGGGLAFINIGDVNVLSGIENETTHHHHSMGYSTRNVTLELEYTKGTCPDFEACVNVEFDPDVSTIVTEWGLLCNKDWIASLIISIQMAGLLVGSLVSGYVGDAIGRKKVLYIALAINGVLSIISAFLESWQAFAAVRFLFGIVLACIMSQYCVLPSEFLNSKWRGRFVAIPTWAFGGMVLAVSAMLCSDWRKLHLIGGVFSFVFCLTSLWVPESLRWLEVKHKTKEFNKVARKIISTNKLNMSVEMEDVDTFVRKNGSVPNDRPDAKRYTILDLFRPGYRMYSIIFGILWFSSTAIFYAINFGLKAMSGNFFINLLLNFATEIPFSIFPVIGPNLLGRKKSSFIFMLIVAVSLIIAACFEIWASGGTKHTGTLVLALLAKTFVDAAFYTLVVQTAEVYPTAVRSIANGTANFAAKIGGILAQFLIPTDPDTIYICYIAMGLVGALCCFLMTRLPETRGMKLKETFEDDDESVE